MGRTGKIEDNKKVSAAEAKAQKAAEEAAKAAAEAKRLAQAGMVTGLKKSSRPGAKQLLEECQKLDRFDEEKTILLNKFQQDKSLKWVTEYFETKTESMKQTQDGASGFCTEYVIADLLKMKHEDPIFKIVISRIPCEEADTWDEEDMVQAGYKLAGLKRYRLETVNTLLKKQKVQENSSTSSASTTLGRNSGPFALSNASSSVKLEVKAYAQLQADAKIISAAEKKFARMLSDLKGCKATLTVSGKPGSLQLRNGVVCRTGWEKGDEGRTDGMHFFVYLHAFICLLTLRRHNFS